MLLAAATYLVVQPKLQGGPLSALMSDTCNPAVTQQLQVKAAIAMPHF